MILPTPKTAIREQETRSTLRTVRSVAWLTAVLLTCMPAAASVEVAEIFGPDMMLQRGVSIPIWGRAAPGETITVTFAGQTKTATTDQRGRWSIRLEALEACAESRPLTVRSEAGPITFDGVRVGDVWLLLVHRVGMQYSTEGPVPSGIVRIRHVGRGRPNHHAVPLERFGNNRAWGPDRHQRLDVVSIPFANRLQEQLGVPVGIVRVEVGGLDATIPRHGFAAIEALGDIDEQVDTWDSTTKRGKLAYAQWLLRMKHWKRTMDEKMAQGDSIAPSQPPRVPGPVPGDPAQPTVVFNRQLHPLVPFALRGALHLHEEPHPDAPRHTVDPRYADKMRALAAGLRVVFKRPDLAFAFTQQNEPNIYHQHTLGGMLHFNAWYGHRDRQRRVLPYKHTGMIVTLDIEHHPGAVGERFARWALAAVHGRGDAPSGPIYKRHRVQGDRLVIQFDHAHDGLMVAAIPDVGRQPTERKNTPLRFFAVAGKDRVFRRAEARIENDTVVLRSDRVAQPVAARYACHFDPRGMNLYNRAGLPASPFRTDDWPIDGFDEAVDRLRSMKPEDLVARLGYPTMLHTHAAAKALASHGKSAVWPLIERLIRSHDPDARCGAVRTLGYLHWMGPVPRNYYGTRPQEVTPAIAQAVERLEERTQDADPMVRRCVAESLSLIGSENERIFNILARLAVDDDALVRTAALRMSKYRFKTHAHNTTLAYAVFKHRPFADRITNHLAGNLLNHYRLRGPIDLNAVGNFLANVGVGQGGGVVGNLGDLLRRIKMDIGRPALNDPRVLPAILHLYAIGYRQYMLYGVERWISYPENVPAYRKKIRQLRADIQRLRQNKPEGWRDLSQRYADAIDGLATLIESIENAKN